MFQWQFNDLLQQLKLYRQDAQNFNLEHRDETWEQSNLATSPSEFHPKFEAFKSV